MSQSSIAIHNVSVKFRLNHGVTLKERFAAKFRRHKTPKVVDFWAVHGITLNIKAGERVGILGHNGAGKSTLLKTLCRIYEPTEGSVEINGKIAPLLEIGAGFHPEFTGRENIYLNGAILGNSKATMQQLEPEIIAFSELGEFIDTPVKYYSTGMYMRLAFSLATAVHPDILVLDELFAGGDVSFVTKAKARMIEMIDRASIMVLCSHDAELMRTLCNRVIWLDHGRLVADGEPDAIIDRYLAGNYTLNEKIVE